MPFFPPDASWPGFLHLKYPGFVFLLLTLISYADRSVQTCFKTQASMKTEKQNLGILGNIEFLVRMRLRKRMFTVCSFFLKVLSQLQILIVLYSNSKCFFRTMCIKDKILLTKQYWVIQVLKGSSTCHLWYNIIWFRNKRNQWLFNLYLWHLTPRRLTCSHLIHFKPVYI